ncbi:hypothetical protein AKJ53_00375 [candidate division MSBL1 archaeon SCGC-AAA382F02]|uniref:Probable ribosomal RNA small subunit methyltransferase A n=1 Tax=candidate division MSBL1 archaeon SCGC-AAA382F02 TaxID=1698282 RepID=A0A133VJ06_9EURY|nr:hypothetical protein AKJ53_00375 [candidate division MSBL1 archaeon SCGC-AAA382F02]
MLRRKTKNLLKKYGIKLSKKYGQSHVVDENILSKITKYADISKDETMLEIGPGIGNLTSFLVKDSEKVISVEKDERLVEALEDRLGDSPNLEIIHGDILEIDFPNFDKIVSNLPYSISSPITFKLLEQDFDLGILMYQKEFAQRMAADPGSSEYSRLSVNVSYRAKIELLDEVPPSAFFPQPEVNSTIVRLEPRERPFKVKDEEVFFQVINGAFQQKRKKLKNGLYYSFSDIFPDLDLSEDEQKEFIDYSLPKEFKNSRPENLTPKDFGEVADLLVENKKDL